MNPYDTPRTTSALQPPTISTHLPWAAIGAFLGMTSVFVFRRSLPIPNYLVDLFYDPVNPYQLISVLMVAGGLVGGLLFDLVALMVWRIPTTRNVDEHGLTVWFWPIAIAMVLVSLALDRHAYGTPPALIAKVPGVIFLATAGYNCLIWRASAKTNLAPGISLAKET